tara:strand:+ start:2184 stop:3212 length:1029 start_codon:yes stop_codon:yes gene_type:complete
MTTIGLLDAERKKASFDVDALTLVLAGSADAHAKKKRMLGIVSGDAVLQRGQASASRTQRHIQSLAKSKRLVELKRKHGWSLEEHIQARRMMGEVLPDDVHYSMFIPNIQSLCSDEQQAHWLPRIESGEVFGCYAQTELSHGSNVRALRTTATYVRETDEIEIDTPDLEATKWWPGGLGLTANHAMVFARLIVDGVDHGVHNFIVQIRDLLTHEPMPGVRLGDIGPKIGYNTVDNGYAAFARVRIPRSNMPCRYTSLTRDGALVRNPGVNPRVSYITMLGNARAVRRGRPSVSAPWRDHSGPPPTSCRLDGLRRLEAALRPRRPSLAAFVLVSDRMQACAPC